MSQMGQKRTSACLQQKVRFTPEADIAVEPINVRFVPYPDVSNPSKVLDAVWLLALPQLILCRLG